MFFIVLVWMVQSLPELASLTARNIGLTACMCMYTHMPCLEIHEIGCQAWLPGFLVCKVSGASRWPSSYRATWWLISKGSLPACGRLHSDSPKMPMSYSPQPVHATLHGKGDFAGVIKLRILKWGDYSEYLDGPHVITRFRTRGNQEGQS